MTQVIYQELIQVLFPFLSHSSGFFLKCCHKFCPKWCTKCCSKCRLQYHHHSFCNKVLTTSPTESFQVLSQLQLQIFFKFFLQDFLKMYPREYCWTNCSILIDFSPRYFFWSNTQVFILSCLYPFCSTSSPNPSFNTTYFFKSCRGRFISSFCYFFQISDKFLLSKLDHCFLVPIFFQVFGTCPIPSDNQTSFPSSDPSFILNSIQVSCSFYAPRSFTLLRLLLVQVLNKISDSSIAKNVGVLFH